MSTYSNNSPRANTRITRLADPREQRKMGIFKKTIAKWIRNLSDDGSYGIAVKSDNSLDTEPQLNFKIFPATGGYILEFRKYDRKIDRYDNQLYVISKDNEDIGASVARIVNMEMMK